jgi:hypothetical protein
MRCAPIANRTAAIIYTTPAACDALSGYAGELVKGLSAAGCESRSWMGLARHPGAAALRERQQP